jgi:hypothetical protein
MDSIPIIAIHGIIPETERRERMNSKRPYLPLAILNLIGFAGVLVVNALATTLPINNKTTGELSDQYPNLFVPAGLTFSIWGVIYTLLAIYTVYQLILAIKDDNRETSVFKQVGLLFFVTCLTNMGWIFAWQYELTGLSVAIMLVFLLTLIALYLRLQIGKSEAPKSEKYLVHLPFSVYLGWISIATIANITAFLVDIGWKGSGSSEQFWAVAVIIVGIALAMVMLFRRRDIYYCLVVDWALLGILLKRLSQETVPAQGVIVISIIGLVLVSLGIVIQVIRKKSY